jgi:hypothetical protein
MGETMLNVWVLDDEERIYFDTLEELLAHVKAQAEELESDGEVDIRISRELMPLSKREALPELY